ncbi:MAG: 30S ribosomal protein S14 [Gammaproteobacteria bacterium]|nr:30S ribosomal protein S14 [Gammaproteobacteria bacterium]MCP4473862.1 30S ribosomal protein S14 [Gammaproteobacteria bacterium]
MAKQSKIAREEQVVETIQRFAEKRQQLLKRRQEIINRGEDPWEVMLELQKLPRNASPVRHRHRCQVCGRPRGGLREFGLCRLHFLRYVKMGLIPNVLKSSW